MLSANNTAAPSARKGRRVTWACRDEPRPDSGLSNDDAGEPLASRLKRVLLKPPEPGTDSDAGTAPGLEELENAEKTASNKERLIGLFAAPLAAAIALVVTNSLIANDPSATLANGQPNKLHVGVGLYHEALVAMLVLSVVVLVMSWFRKRLFVGIGMALYGLAIFNLRFWGFGIPFLVGGAWYLARSYRLHQRLRDARGNSRWRPELAASDSGASPLTRPTANKRYTPPHPRSRQ